MLLSQQASHGKRPCGRQRSKKEHMHSVMVSDGNISSTADVRIWRLRRQQSLHVEMPNLMKVGISIDEPRNQQDQTQR